MLPKNCGVETGKLKSKLPIRIKDIMEAIVCMLLHTKKCKV